MKACFKLFVFISLFCFSNLLFAGFGNGLSSEPTDNTEEEGAPKESNDFGTGKDFSRDNFSQNDQIMDAGDGDGPPPPPPIPLDGGVSLLLLGGIGLGIKKLFDKK
jgi:hypothetical protein